MANLADLRPDLALEVRGVPALVGDRALNDAAIELLRESDWWHHTYVIAPTLDPVTVPAPEPEENRVQRVIDVFIDGRKLSPELDYTMTDRDTVVLQQYHSTDEQLQIVTALVPRRGATTVPDDLLEEFALPIVAGAAMRLAAIPDTDWEAPGKVGYFRQRFEDGIASARRARLDQYLRATSQDHVVHEFY